MFYSRTSSCPTTPLLVLASRTLVSLPRFQTLGRNCHAARKHWVARWGSCLRNSWCLGSLAIKEQCQRHRQTSTLLDWLSSRYANWITGTTCFYVYLPQVLQGESPFRGIKDWALAWHVLRGDRPGKPENAPAIGFSDSLWDFTERCWDGKMEFRPEVGEVVNHLEEAATKWNGLMPPCVQAKAFASGSEGAIDLTGRSEFEILIFP